MDTTVVEVLMTAEQLIDLESASRTTLDDAAALSFV